MRATLLLPIFVLALSPLAHAGDEPPRALRGVAQRLEIRGVTCALRARPTDPRTAPVVVSVEASGEVQRLEVVGLRTGDVGLAVTTRSLPSALLSSRPAWLWKALAAAWLAVPLLWALRRWIRWRSSRPTPPPPEPIRLDALTELVVTMGVRPLTIPERGTLELLTLRALLELRSASASTTGNLYTEARLDPQAAPLLDALERWLHHPSTPDQPPARLRKALSELADRLAAARHSRAGGAA